MYYTADELETILANNPPLPRNEQRAQLKILANTLAQQPEYYRLFGPYWWPLKRVLQDTGLATRHWFRGTTMDQQVAALWPSEAGGAQAVFTVAEYYRAQQDLGLDTQDNRDIPYHFVEFPGGRVELYELCDVDAGRQLDLFESAQQQQQANQAFLDNPANFIARTWSQGGDELHSQGRFHEAIRYYKRAVLLSRDTEERSALWLRIGLTLGEAGHHWKAIFAYTNCYQTGEEAWVLGHIGQAYEDLGLISKASSSYEQALTHMPGNPEYQQALARLKTKQGATSLPVNESATKSSRGTHYHNPSGEPRDDQWEEDSQVSFGFTSFSAG